MDSEQGAESSPRSISNSVELRDIVESDLDFFYKYQLDPESNRFIGLAPRSKSESDAHWAKIMSDDQAINQTIIADGEVVGNIVCFYLGGHREVGYRLGREHWGKGIATKALSRLLLLVPDRPLFAHVAKLNYASCRVLEKCGFVIVGEDQMPSQVTDETIEEWVMRLD